MRKSTAPQRDYRKAALSYEERLDTFRRQMSDFARGDMLRRLRENRHMSQEDAAHEIGVSVKSLRAWEKGGGIHWRNAQKAADYYGIDPERVVSRELVASGGEPPDERLERLLAGQVELLQALAEARNALEARLTRIERAARSRAENSS